jgi:hypothetical protein
MVQKYYNMEKLRLSVATGIMFEIQSFGSKNSIYSLDLVIVYTVELWYTTSRRVSLL